MSETRELTVAESSELTTSITEILRAGKTPDFDDFKAEHPDNRVDDVEFRDAALAAERLVAGTWGVGPSATGKRISRDLFSSLPLPEQAKYIREGGQLYDLPDPKAVDPSMEIMRNKRGESITKGEFDQKSPSQKMAWCIAA